MKPIVTDVVALILFTDKLEAAVKFYTAIGVPLELEQHDDGILHYACELGLTHFAIFESNSDVVPEFRSGGSSFLGFTVNSLEDALEAARLHFRKGQVWIHHYNQLLNHLSALDELLSHI